MRSQLEYMFAMVPGGTRLSVSDDNRLPPSRTPLAGASVATFQPLLARVSYSAIASSRGRLTFAVGLAQIATIPRRERGYSASGPTNTGSITGFSEKLSNQAEPSC
jgi:hypothetical protein